MGFRSGRRCYYHLCVITLFLPFVIPVTQVEAATRSSPAHSISEDSSPGGLFAALRSTLLHHPSLASQQALVRSKEASADSARAARLPTLGASAGSGQIAGYNDSRTTTLSVSQPLWAFGRIDSAIDYADNDTLAQQATAWATRRELLEDTAVAYANVQGIRERLTVAESNVNNHQALQEQIQRRAQGGLASSADVSLAKARLLQARASFEQAKSDLRTAESTLLSLTQVPVASELPVPDSILRLPADKSVQEQILAQSATVRAREAAVTLAESDVERQRTSSRPTVSLQASRNEYSSMPNQRDNNTVNVVVTGTMEGLGLVSRGLQNAALERVESARQDLAEQRHSEDVQTRQLLDQRDANQTLMAGYEQSVVELSGTLASFRRQYESGYKSWLDVLNAVRELTEQQQALVSVRSAWRVDCLRLAARTGRMDDTTGALPTGTQFANTSASQP
ncbi:TolC family protein [Phytobacter palmae]|uniref:TolC family protein n=1 Tax=Phytobacter palmae TaxID=1855371 RepID=A0ABU9VCX8_9ENTR